MLIAVVRTHPIVHGHKAPGDIIDLWLPEFDTWAADTCKHLCRVEWPYSPGIEAQLRKRYASRPQDGMMSTLPFRIDDARGNPLLQSHQRVAFETMPPIIRQRATDMWSYTPIIPRTAYRRRIVDASYGYVMDHQSGLHIPAAYRRAG